MLAGMSPQSKGIAAMVLAAALLSAHDAVSKYLAQSYPIGQVVFYRQMFSLALLAVFIQVFGGWTRLKINSYRGQGIRAIAFIAATVLIVTSVAALPLATALSIIFASPLVLAALSVPLLGERVGLHRWLAILGGFAGVLIIIRPIDPAFNWLLLLPVCAACSSALRDIATRLISRTEDPLSILFWSNIAVIIASALTLPIGFAPFGMRPIAAVDYAWLALAGYLNIQAHFLMISALRIADAALVAPFRYSALIWAALLGYLVWNHVPDGWTVVGALVIVASGIYLLIRERRAAAHGKPAPARH
ncbi:MAG: DMT family transporter [Hyphomicrobiaceae bacterium]|nr:DMT family transporter [Hyphomicrobiaceae bacterium]